MKAASDFLRHSSERLRALAVAHAALLTVAVVGSTSCQGQVSAVPGTGGAGAIVGTGGGAGTISTGGGGGRPGPGTGGMAPLGGAGTGGAGITATDCKEPHAAALRARLLSGGQYNNTLLDMLQVTGEPGTPFGDKVFEQLDDTRVEQRANAAATVAKQAVLNLARWSPCVPPATGDASACELQLIDKIGAKAFRRPLVAEERAQMKTLFDAGVKEKDFATGAEWFLTGVLQSPDFLYELAKPAPTEQPGQVRPLAPYEYASRLAYFVWNSMPDDKLFAAAAADELSDATKRQVQLTRMIADPKFMRGVEGFYSRWLNLNAFRELARNAPGFTEQVVNSLSTSLLMSATQLYASATPNIASLFTGESYYMNDVLRGFYGLPGTGTTYTAAAMTGQSRRGIVTHPALMAMLARPAESFPISRGLFVLRTLMCKEVPLPNGLTIPELPAIADGVSTRQRLEMHAKNALCATCHNRIDPPGFALENFDEVGKFRTLDHGIAVDSSGTLALGVDVDGDFARGDDLLAKLAGSANVRSCFAEQYLRYAVATQETDPADACSVDALARSFVPSGDLKQLVSALVSSDAFRMRLAEGVAP